MSDSISYFNDYPASDVPQVRYNKETMLKAYDKYLANDVDIAQIMKVNPKRYQYRTDMYMFTIVTQEKYGDVLIEVYDFTAKEFIISGVVHDSLIKKKLIQDAHFYDKALNDRAFKVLGITVEGEEDELDGDDTGNGDNSSSDSNEG